MRIIIASPPRSGNHWLRCLLGQMYGLTEAGSGQINPRFLMDADEFSSMPDASIAHMHGRYSNKVVRAINALPAHIVTAVRDPYDVFLSYYHWVQTRASGDSTWANRGTQRPRSQIVGKALDDPAVLDYLGNKFGEHLSRANGWLHSGQAIPVRYEDLHAAPEATLTEVARQIAPITAEMVARAVANCQIDTYRQTRPEMAHTLRSGTVGESKQRLNEDHLRVFRERWTDQIRSLGYPVR